MPVRDQPGKSEKPRLPEPSGAEDKTADEARREREQETSEPPSAFESSGAAPLGVVGIFSDRGRKP